MCLGRVALQPRSYWLKHKTAWTSRGRPVKVDQSKLSLERPLSEWPRDGCGWPVDVTGRPRDDFGRPMDVHLAHGRSRDGGRITDAASWHLRDAPWLSTGWPQSAQDRSDTDWTGCITAVATAYGRRSIHVIWAPTDMWVLECSTCFKIGQVSSVTLTRPWRVGVFFLSWRLFLLRDLSCWPLGNVAVI